MKLNIQDDVEVGRFIELIQKTDPEITDQCTEVIDMMKSDSETLIPITRIKRLARQQTEQYQEAMGVAVAVAESPLISTLTHGGANEDETDGLSVK